MTNFPANPAINEKCVADNGSVYIWNGQLWVKQTIEQRLTTLEQEVAELKKQQK